MEELFIGKIKVDQPLALSKAENILEQQTTLNFIDIVNWKQFSYQPKVAFCICHVGNEIWLKYYVSEKYILALETRTNGDVYKDSCVEFFISIDGNNYYNFEFNCIGTTHLAYGTGRHNRKFVNPEIIKKIEISSSLGNQPFKERKGVFEWEMIIRIPIECFAFDNLKTLNGLNATVNFYKCGDATSEPHYITWNPVKTKSPDYHQPNSFGKVFFEK